MRTKYLCFNYSRDNLKHQIKNEMRTYAGYLEPTFNIAKIISLDLNFDAYCYSNPVVPDEHGIQIEMENPSSYFLQKEFRISVRLGNMEWDHRCLPMYILGQPKPILRHTIELEACYIRLQLLEKNYGLWSTIPSEDGSTVVDKKYRFKPTSRFKRMYYVDPLSGAPNHALMFAEDPDFLNLIENDIVEFVNSIFSREIIEINP